MAPAFADDFADVVRTPSVGQYEKTTNFLFVITSKTYPAAIPAIVRAGSTIPFVYQKDGKSVSDNFFVAEITMKKDLCRLRNQLRGPNSGIGDIIYVKPCRKLE